MEVDIGRTAMADTATEDMRTPDMRIEPPMQVSIAAGEITRSLITTSVHTTGITLVITRRGLITTLTIGMVGATAMVGVTAAGVGAPVRDGAGGIGTEAVSMWLVRAS
jgi:hypothetical protein